MQLILLVILLMILYNRAFVMKSSLTHSSMFSTFRTNMKSRLTNEQLMELSVHKNIVDASSLLTKTKYLLAVSGGSDSMAMLHLFQNIKMTLAPALKFKVVNFNHRLREESHEEAAFIESVCKQYGVPFECIKAEENQFSKNLQNTARDWRRECYDKIVDASEDPMYVVTGHTLDDQTETLLMKLLRGIHISNFQPMSVLDGKYLKPLLTVSKSDLRNYLVEKGLEWREDLSNTDNKYKRNVVRNEVIPLLTKVTGSDTALQSRLFNLAEQSIDLQHWIQKEANKVLTSVTYYEYPTDTYPHIIDFTNVENSEEVLSNPLLMSHIINEWIVKHTGESISYENMKKIMTTFASLTVSSSEVNVNDNNKNNNDDKNNNDFKVKRKAVSINSEWEAVMMEKQFRLKRLNVIKKFEMHSCAYGSKGRIHLNVSSDLSVNLKRAYHFPFKAITSLVNTSTKLNNIGNSIPLTVTFNSLKAAMDGLIKSNTKGMWELNLRVRFPQDGDTFQPKWKDKPITVGQFLSGQGVPLSFRDRVLLVTYERESAIKSLQHNEVLAVIMMNGDVFYSKRMKRVPDEDDDESLELKLKWKHN